ncbi:MAG: phosphatase PAP2 family protein, partial [Actinomycetota bacterium]
AQEKQELLELKDEAAERTVEIKGLIDKWDDQPPFRPWTELNLELVAARPKDPVNASRGYGYVHAAIYDAVVSAYHWKSEYKRPRPKGIKTAIQGESTPSYPSAQAAIAGAASRVISYLFPERPAGLLDSLAEEAAESRVQAGVSYRSDVEAGLALGRAVAEKVIARAKADGSDAKWDGKRPIGPQYYRAPTGSTAEPVQPLAGSWKAWVMATGSQFRPPPPPEYGSAKFLEEAKELIEIKNKLTAEQKRIATFWAGGEGTSLPPGVWNEVLLSYAKENDLSIPRAARVFALLNVSMSDGGIAAWDAKYAYWNPRPETAIEDLGLEPGWKPYIDTPFFPAYISGHSAYSAAAAEVMSYLYPEDKGFFQKKAAEAGISRLYGGIHWRSDNEQGLAVGRKVGALVVQRAKQDGAGD